MSGIGGRQGYSHGLGQGGGKNRLETFGGDQGNQSGTGAQGASGAEQGGSTHAMRAGHYQQMPE